MECPQEEQASIEKLKNILLGLPEAKLNVFFMKAVLKCRTIEDIVAFRIKATLFLFYDRMF
ncbi:MAG: hypothetical protein OXI43_13870, partial [Candidatus Poribacteria bacterium]|nr:hypothetical protein [Candidatus Poribacteria bacterium]